MIFKKKKQNIWKNNNKTEPWAKRRSRIGSSTSIIKAWTDLQATHVFSSAEGFVDRSPTIEKYRNQFGSFSCVQPAITAVLLIYQKAQKLLPESLT